MLTVVTLGEIGHGRGLGTLGGAPRAVRGVAALAGLATRVVATRRDEETVLTAWAL